MHCTRLLLLDFFTWLQNWLVLHYTKWWFLDKSRWCFKTKKLIKAMNQQLYGRLKYWFAAAKGEEWTYRQTLAQHTGLLELPWTSKLLHVSAEVAVSTLRSHTGLTALTPAARHVTTNVTMRHTAVRRSTPPQNVQEHKNRPDSASP